MEPLLLLLLLRLAEPLLLLLPLLPLRQEYVTGATSPVILRGTAPLYIFLRSLMLFGMLHLEEPPLRLEEPLLRLAEPLLPLHQASTE